MSDTEREKAGGHAGYDGNGGLRCWMESEEER